MARANQLNLRLSDDEAAAITAAAAKAGMPVSEWLRVVACYAAGGAIAKQLQRTRKVAVKAPE